VSLAMDKEDEVLGNFPEFGSSLINEAPIEVDL
jgi:hypothetical protein